MINGIIKAMFDGYKETQPRRNHKGWEYESLTRTPFLHSSDYLNSMYEDAQSDFEKDCIVDHMVRHDAWDTNSYKRLEQKIIDERWS